MGGPETLNEGFPKLGVPFLGVPIIRTIAFWGLYWGPLISGNYQIDLSDSTRCPPHISQCAELERVQAPKC